MILIRPTLNAGNIGISSNKNGRVLIVNLTIQDEKFCLANIYVLNDQSLQVDFCTQLTSKAPSTRIRIFSNPHLFLSGYG